MITEFITKNLIQKITNILGTNNSVAYSNKICYKKYNIKNNKDKLDMKYYQLCYLCNRFYYQNNIIQNE